MILEDRSIGGVNPHGVKRPRRMRHLVHFGRRGLRQGPAFATSLFHFPIKPSSHSTAYSLQSQTPWAISAQNRPTKPSHSHSRAEYWAVVRIQIHRPKPRPCPNRSRRTRLGGRLAVEVKLVVRLMMLELLLLGLLRYDLIFSLILHILPPSLLASICLSFADEMIPSPFWALFDFLEIEMHCFKRDSDCPFFNEVIKLFVFLCTFAAESLLLISFTFRFFSAEVAYHHFHCAIRDDSDA